MSADKRTPFEIALGDTPIQVVSLGENLPSYTTLHYLLQLALAERDKARADVVELRAALRELYEHNADYIRLNHLGPVDHNHCMSQAHITLARLEAESKP